MKSLLFITLLALAGCASPTFPTYFKYQPTGGVFLSEDTPRRRLEWMLSRQDDPAIVGLVRSHELRTTGKLNPNHGACFQKSQAVLLGTQGHPELGNFTIASKDDHAFVLWTTPTGEKFTIDGTTISPL